MTKKEYTIDNIHEFYEAMDKSLNPNVRKMMVYAWYARDKERKEKESEVAQQYKHGAYFAHMVSDNIFIVEEVKGADTLGYFAYVNGYKSSYIWDTFDEALLCALSIKYTGREDCTGYLLKLLK